MYALGTFFSVILVGVFWRLCSMMLASSDNPTAQDIGQGMAFAY